MPLEKPGYQFLHAWHLFVIRLDTDKAGLSRDEFMAALKARGIGTGLHFRAVHTQKFYREQFPTPAGILPHTDWNNERICSLPLFPDMSERDVERVAAAIRTILSETKS